MFALQGWEVGLNLLGYYSNINYIWFMCAIRTKYSFGSIYRSKYGYIRIIYEPNAVHSNKVLVSMCIISNIEYAMHCYSNNKWHHYWNCYTDIERKSIEYILLSSPLLNVTNWNRTRILFFLQIYQLALRRCISVSVWTYCAFKNQLISNNCSIFQHFSLLPTMIKR